MTDLVVTNGITKDLEVIKMTDLVVTNGITTDLEVMKGLR